VVELKDHDLLPPELVQILNDVALPYPNSIRLFSPIIAILPEAEWGYNQSSNVKPPKLFNVPFVVTLSFDPSNVKLELVEKEVDFLS